MPFNILKPWSLGTFGFNISVFIFMCVLRRQEHQHVYGRTAEWTTTLHWNAVMPEQTTETNEPDRCKYIHSAVWRDDFKMLMCALRCQEHQHVYERTAEWTATLHWSTVMPEQTTETNEPDWYKYILSTAWRDGFFRKGFKKFLLKNFFVLKNFLSRNNPDSLDMPF